MSRKGGEELIEEFERAVDLKTRHLKNSDSAYVSPIEYKQANANASGVFTEEINLGKGVNDGDISMTLKGRILTVELKKKEKGEAFQEFGKMFTLPKNVDISQLTSVLTSEGNLKIQAPYGNSTQSTRTPQAPQQKSQAPPQQQQQQKQQTSRTTNSWGASVPAQSNSGRPGGADSPGSLAVERHNQLRKKHGSPPVILSVQLSEQAQNYATALVNGKKGEHDSGLGRNVFQIQTTGSSNMSASEAVREALSTWYEHQSEYNWGAPMTSPQYAKLFTQLVWASSSAIGVGVASRGGLTVVTVLYSPAGNIMSDQRYKENVFRAKN